MSLSRAHTKKEKKKEAEHWLDSFSARRESGLNQSYIQVKYGLCFYTSYTQLSCAYSVLAVINTQALAQKCFDYIHCSFCEDTF